MRFLLAPPLLNFFASLSLSSASVNRSLEACSDANSLLQLAQEVTTKQSQGLRMSSMRPIEQHVSMFEEDKAILPECSSYNESGATPVTDQKSCDDACWVGEGISCKEFSASCDYKCGCDPKDKNCSCSASFTHSKCSCPLSNALNAFRDLCEDSGYYKVPAKPAPRKTAPVCNAYNISGAKPVIDQQSCNAACWVGQGIACKDFAYSCVYRCSCHPKDTNCSCAAGLHTNHSKCSCPLSNTYSAYRELCEDSGYNHNRTGSTLLPLATSRANATPACTSYDIGGAKPVSDQKSCDDACWFAQNISCKHFALSCDYKCGCDPKDKNCSCAASFNHSKCSCPLSNAYNAFRDLCEDSGYYKVPPTPAPRKTAPRCNTYHSSGAKPVFDQQSCDAACWVGQGIACKDFTFSCDYSCICRPLEKNCNCSMGLGHSKCSCPLTNAYNEFRDLCEDSGRRHRVHRPASSSSSLFSNMVLTICGAIGVAIALVVLALCMYAGVRRWHQDQPSS